MKGALIVCHPSADFLEVLLRVADETPKIRAFSYEDSVQLIDLSDRKLTAFGASVPLNEWEAERDAVAAHLFPGDPGLLDAHEVECRWEDMFCDVFRAAATMLHMVVVDTNGKLHLAKELNSESIQL